MRWLFLPLLLPPVASCSTVQTPLGDIKGFEHITESGIPIHTFLGIRYGKAPDGDGRFQKPEMVEKWAPSLLTAQNYGAACFPYTEKFMSDKQNYSEDCLFLNIITPKLSGGADLPVMVLIHGGGFGIGSSHDYDYKRFAELFAADGIVVVTINYRLGPFGFFSLGDSIGPGNMGLWDQTLALKFLHKVLPSFGGDVSRITIGGNSAGSCSSSALQFSPHSNKLFSQGILMAGSFLSELSNTQAVVEESKKLAEELGCKEKTTTQTISCLQQRTTREIIQAVDKLGTTRHHPNVLTYQPRMDGEFFPDAIDKLAKTAPKKRTLSGTSSHEGAFFVFYEAFSFLTGLIVPKSDWTTYSRDDLIEFIETVVVTDQEHGDSAPAFRHHLIKFYVEKDEKKGDSTFYLERFVDLVGDLLFLMPLYNEVQLKLANNWPTFLYIVQHSPKGTSRDEFPVGGAYHGDEIAFFMDFFMYPKKENDPEFDSCAHHFSTALVNFIKKGDPSSPAFTWLPISKEHPFHHAPIVANISMKKEPYRPDAARLWLETVPKLVPIEALRRSRMPGAVDTPFAHSEL